MANLNSPFTFWLGALLTGAGLIGSALLMFGFIDPPWWVALLIFAAILVGSLITSAGDRFADKARALARQWRVKQLAAVFGYLIGVPLAAIGLDELMHWSWIRSDAAWTIGFIGFLVVFFWAASDTRDNPLGDDYFPGSDPDGPA